MNDAIPWLRKRIRFEEGDSSFLYGLSESQSGKSLPVVYIPFDPVDKGHFSDRANILDYAAHAGKGRVLDFGPGDGWPSLPMASFVAEVIGVDGSARRVDVCTENAKRLGISNAKFLHVAPGASLPFPDGSFDAVVAASSVEQAPDPRATLAEFFRVLRPRGRLRMHYESLGFYRGGQERQVGPFSISERETAFLVYDRCPDEERVDQYALILACPVREVRGIFERNGAERSYAGLSQAVLEDLASRTVRAARWTTRHPSCRTWLSWLREAGFQRAAPTHHGGAFAERLFDRIPEGSRPADLGAVDAYLAPLVQAVVTMRAPDTAPPGEWEPWISAQKQ